MVAPFHQMKTLYPELYSFIQNVMLISASQELIPLERYL